MINDIQIFLDNNHLLYEKNVDLKKRTWIHRGGIANLFISPKNEQELSVIVSYLYKHNVQFLLIGHTSNLYVLNTTDLPVVISTAKCQAYTLKGETLYCEAGVGVIKLSNQLLKQGIKGFEYLTGLPGTVSAALVNNSSCKSNSISDLLISAKVLLKTGDIVEWTSNDFEFSFRSSILKRKEVEGCILSVFLKAQKGDAEELNKIAEANKLNRKERLDGNTQNLGCIFDEPYCLGSMKIKYKIVKLSIRTIGKIFAVSNIKINTAIYKILCKMSHCEEALPYISRKNVLVFIWHDDGADKAFSVYCRFMNEVYRTNKLEIEVIE